MTIKTLIYHLILTTLIITTISCSNQNNDSNVISKIEDSETSKAIAENEPEIKSGESNNNIEGKVIFEVNGKVFRGDVFFVDPSTPRSEWNTNNMEGMENELPFFAANMVTLSPNDIQISIGVLSSKINDKMLSGSFSMDVNTENPFTISILMDQNMKNFTFSTGTVIIDKLTPEMVSLKAEGTGLYSDIEKQEYLENEKATIELEISFPNIIVDGKDVKRVEF